jgi:hypothetical protein
MDTRDTPQSEALLAPTHRATSSARGANSTYAITGTINYARAAGKKDNLAKKACDNCIPRASGIQPAIPRLLGINIFLAA